MGQILVVEDDPNIRDTVTLVLEWSGYQVHAAEHGQRGLEVLDRFPVDLILLDMRMPVMDGWAFARALAERGVETPVVVMTAAYDAQRWAEEIGAQGCLAKPFEIPTLLQTVAQYAS